VHVVSQTHFLPTRTHKHTNSKINYLPRKICIPWSIK